MRSATCSGKLCNSQLEIVVTRYAFLKKCAATCSIQTDFHIFSNCSQSVAEPKSNGTCSVQLSHFIGLLGVSLLQNCCYLSKFNVHCVSCTDHPKNSHFLMLMGHREYLPFQSLDSTHRMSPTS